MKTIQGVVKDPPIQYHPDGFLRDARNAAYKNGVYTNTWGAASQYSFGVYFPIGELVLPDESILVFQVQKVSAGVYLNRIQRILPNWDVEVVSVFNYGWTDLYPIRARARLTRESDIEVVITDNNTPPRLITLELNPNGTLIGLKQVTLDQTLLFPNITLPSFELVAVGSGGGWEAGAYEVMIAYEYFAGEGFTNWIGLSNAVILKDKDGSITMKIRDFDNSFSRYKIGVIQKIDTGTFGWESDYELNVPTEVDSDGILSGTVTLIKSGMASIEIASLLVQRLGYDRIGDFTTSEGYLYAADVSTNRLVDYQQYANQIKISPIYGDDIPIDSQQGSYADALTIYNKAAFMDYEVYAFYVRLYGHDCLPLGNWFIPAENVGGGMLVHTNNERYPDGFGYPTESGGGPKLVKFHKFPGKPLASFISKVAGVAEPAPSASSSIHKTLTITGDFIPDTLRSVKFIAIGANTGTYGTVGNYGMATNRAWTSDDGDPVLVTINLDITFTLANNPAGNPTVFQIELYKDPSATDPNALVKSWNVYHADYLADHSISDVITINISDTLKIDMETNQILMLGGVFNGTESFGVNSFWSVENDVAAGDNATVYTKPTGITVENIQIPSALADKVQAFEILYAKRNTSNSRVIEEGFLFDGDIPTSEYTMGVNKRLHAFGLLLDKPALSITDLWASFIYESSSGYENGNYKERLLNGTIIQGELIIPLVPTVDNWNEVVADAKYIQYNNSALDNKYGETHIRVRTKNSITSTLTKFRATTIAVNKKTNYYQPFDAQITQSTGKVFRMDNAGIASMGLIKTSVDPSTPTFKISELYGGDTFTCMYETRISDEDGKPTIMAAPVRSKYNIALREFNEDVWHEAGVATDPPDEAIDALFPDTTADYYDRRRKTIKSYDVYLSMNRGHLDYNLTRVAEIQGDDIEEYPYRIIRTPEQATESPISSWRIFKPDDYFELTRDRGPITNLATLDSDKVIIHCERGLFYTKGSQRLVTNVDEIVLGTGNPFEPTPSEAVYTEEGYLGSTKKFFNKTTRLGYTFESNGRIFTLSNQLKQISELGMSFYLRNLIDGVGDNPYLQDSGDANYTGGMSVAYDDNYDRLMIAINNGSDSETWSYNTKIGATGAWESQFDYVDTKFFNTSKKLLAFNSHKLFEHNANNRAIGYDGVIKDTVLTAVFSQPGDITKYFYGPSWVSVVRKDGVSYLDKTFSTLRAYNSELDLGAVTLTPLGTDIYTNWNTRRSFGTWRFNELRTSGASLVDKKKFVDLYLALELTYDNSDQDDLEVNQIDVGFNTIVR